MAAPRVPMTLPPNKRVIMTSVWSGLPSPASPPRRGRTTGRRALLVGAAGVAVALAAFGLSQIDGGVLNAVFFVLALLMIPMTAGSVIAATYAAWQERPAMPRGCAADAGAHHRCGICHRKLTQVGPLRLCPRCDSLALHASTGQRR
jgi:hypothetical protein